MSDKKPIADKNVKVEADIPAESVKAREFWFSASNTIDPQVLDVFFEKPDFEPDFHVIEHSAYAALKEELDHCMKNYQDLGLHINKDKNLERLQKDFAALKQECEELKERVEITNGTNKLKQMTIHELQGQRDELRAELEKLQSDCNMYKADAAVWKGNCLCAREKLEKAKQHDLTIAVMAKDIEQIEKLKAEASEWKKVADEKHEAYMIAFNQAMENGAKALAYEGALEFVLKGLEMWRKYQSPANVTEVIERAREVLEKWRGK